MKIKNLKKIIYIPGMISMAGLLLIFKFIVMPRFMPAGNETVIKHNIPSEHRNNPYSGYWTIEQHIKKKKIIHIDLTGDDPEDDKKVDFIRQEARRLKYTHDTTAVIEIYLANEINYGRFVELVNIMLIDKHKRYALWKNNFYVYGENPPVEFLHEY